MSAADDAREALEALLWRLGLDAGKVDAILTAADVYALEVAASQIAKATAKAAKPKPGAPAEKKPPAMHFAAGDTTACLPYERARLLGTRMLTDNPAEVTCGHCRKTPAWRDAAGLEES